MNVKYGMLSQPGLFMVEVGDRTKVKALSSLSTNFTKLRLPPSVKIQTPLLEDVDPIPGGALRALLRTTAASSFL